MEMQIKYETKTVKIMKTILRKDKQMVTRIVMKKKTVKRPKSKVV